MVKKLYPFFSYSKCPRTYACASKIGTSKYGKKIVSIFSPIQNVLVHIHVPAKYIGNTIYWVQVGLRHRVARPKAYFGKIFKIPREAFAEGYIETVDSKWIAPSLRSSARVVCLLPTLGASLTG